MKPFSETKHTPDDMPVCVHKNREKSKNYRQPKFGLDQSFFAIFFLICFLLSCNNNPEAPKPTPVYTVTFDSNGGSSVTSVTVEQSNPTPISKPASFYEKKDPNDPDPNAEKVAKDPIRTASQKKKVSYTFAGWYRDEGLTLPYDFNSVVSADITLYAKWNEHPFHTVTFDSKPGASKSNEARVEDKKEVTKPTDPIRAGYEFLGWFEEEALTTKYDFSKPVKADITLHAKWGLSAPTYDVTFDSNGGLGTVSVVTVSYGKEVSKPSDPVRKAYKFSGWFRTDMPAANEPMFVFKGTGIIADITLYAGWEPAAFFTFNSNGGSAVLKATVVVGETLTKPKDPTREGYNFDGWFLDEKLDMAYVFATPIASTQTGDITLYAKWTKQP